MWILQQLPHNQQQQPVLKNHLCLAAVLGTTPETATLAVMYLRVRCFACPAFLLYNVGTGNFRGRKDTRTPLLAYLANNITYVLLVSSCCDERYLITHRLLSNDLCGAQTLGPASEQQHASCSLCLAQELLFVFGLNWGVMGAALAPAIGQYVGLAVMVGLLLREKALYAGDLGHVPTLQEVTPLLQVHLWTTVNMWLKATMFMPVALAPPMLIGLAMLAHMDVCMDIPAVSVGSILKARLTGLLHPARSQKGLPLGAVNLLVLPVVVGCTSLVTALGVTALAAHTIIKQVWDFWTQVSPVPQHRRQLHGRLRPGRGAAPSRPRGTTRFIDDRSNLAWLMQQLQ